MQVCALQPSIAAAMAGKSPILAAIERATGHPQAAKSELEQHAFSPPGSQARPRGLPPLPKRKKDSNAPSAILSAAAISVAVLAVSKVAAQSAHLRRAFQSRWARIEDRAARTAQLTTQHSKRAMRMASNNRERIKNQIRRFAPVLAGFVAATLVSGLHRRGEQCAINRGDVPARLLTTSSGALSSGSPSRPASRTAAFGVFVAGCAIAQAAVTHKPSHGVNDPYRRLRRRVHHTSMATSHKSSRTIRSRVVHRALLAIVAWKASRQQTPERGSRKYLVLAGLSSAGAEYMVRRGTARQVPVEKLRARARKTRAHLAMHGQALKQRTGSIAHSLRKTDYHALATSRKGVATGGAVALAAVVLVAARTAGKGEPEPKPWAMPRWSDLPRLHLPDVPNMKVPHQVHELINKANNIRLPSNVKVPFAHRQASDDCMAEKCSNVPPDSLPLSSVLARPPLLLLAAASCDAALRERGVLHHVAPQMRKQLQQRAAQVKAPQPLVVTGVHVRRGAQALWGRLRSAMAYVPARALLCCSSMHCIVGAGLLILSFSGPSLLQQ